MSKKQNNREAILAYLAEFPNIDCRELAEAFNIQADTMRDCYIKPFRAEGKVYVSSYVSEQFHQIACYSVGNRKDVKKPTKSNAAKEETSKPEKRSIREKHAIVPIPQPPIDPLTAFALGL